MKFFRKLHLWMSVPFGIFITLICFSGAMLIFEPEITRSVRHDVYYTADSSGETLPVDSIMRGVAASLPDSVKITGVSVFPDKDRCWQVNLSKPRRASLFVNQYTGEITGRYERLPFFSTMFKLHRWLCDSANPKGDGMKIGKLLVGISTVIFILALITGIIIWTPVARRGFWKSLRISAAKGWPFFWKTFHVGGGMWALLFVLAMALTGLNYSFDWYRKGFYAVFGVEMKPRNIEGNDRESGKKHNPEGDRHNGNHGMSVSADSLPAGQEILVADNNDRNDSDEARDAHASQYARQKKSEKEASSASAPESSDRPEADASERRHGRGDRHGRRENAGEEAAPRPRRESRDSSATADVMASADGERRHGRGRRDNAEQADSAFSAVAAPVAENTLADTENAAPEATADRKVRKDGAHTGRNRTERTSEKDGRPEDRTGRKDHNRNYSHEDGAKERHGERNGDMRGERNGNRHGRKTEESRAIDFSNWGKALAEMEKMYPSAPQITIGDGSASATLGNFGNARAADKFSFESTDGILTPATMYSDAEKADKLRGWIYAFHTGTPLGIVTRVIWFLSALLGASLPLTGYYIWIRRLVLRRRGIKARDSKASR